MDKNENENPKEDFNSELFERLDMIISSRKITNLYLFIIVLVIIILLFGG